MQAKNEAETLAYQALGVAVKELKLGYHSKDSRLVLYIYIHIHIYIYNVI